MPHSLSRPSRPSRPATWLHGLCLAMLTVLAAPALAQDLPQELGAVTQRWLDAALAQEQAGGALPLRMEVSVGQLDPRLRLAPCARVEPHLPAGARLWGRTRLGLRCVEGAVRWNVYLPITVKAYGPAWVLTGSVATGAVLKEGDATEAEVDWAAESAAIVARPEAWVGLIAARPLQPGQALRQNMVRAPDLFKSGASVRVVAQGQGYAVTASGQAMSNGAQGQHVRVRMGNGRLVSGVVLEDGTIAAGL